MRTMISLAVIAILAVLAGHADAKPRLVVLEFDGPAPEAKVARAALIAMLAEKYAIVPTRTWTEARAKDAGAAGFRAAARTARVGAIIEGWFDTDRTPTLTLAVRDAQTGKELEQVAEPVRNMVVTPPIGAKLVTKLDGVLGALDTEVTAEPEHVLAEVALPAKQGDVLASIFEPRPVAYTDEQKIVLGVRPKAPSPRLQLSIGPYLQSRGMAWDANPNSSGTPPEYPGSSISGVAARLALYPFPDRDGGARLSGPGVTFEMAHSIGSTLTAVDDQGAVGDYTLTHTSWEAGAHYRWLADLASIDLGVGVGQTKHELEDQFPQSVAIPNTDYRYVTGGARVDLAVTDRASVGVGARYLYLLGAGQVSEEKWYGAGSASGLVVDAQTTIPLPHGMYVTASLEYRRVEIEFEGSGVLTNDWGLSSVLDSSITGSAQLGVSL